MKKLIFWEIITSIIVLGVFYVTPNFQTGDINISLIVLIAITAIISGTAVAIAAFVAAIATFTATINIVAITDVSIFVAVFAFVIVIAATDIKAPKKWVITSLTTQALIIFGVISAFT